MKKILFITWSASAGGGSEKILYNLTNSLSKEYEVDILEVYRFNNKMNFGDKIRLLYPLLDKSDKRYIHIIKRIFFEFFPNTYKKIVCKGKYDYEIAFNYLYPAYLLDKDTKSIAWNHGSIENLLDESEKKNRNKYRKSLKHINKIVAISNKTKDSILEVYPEYKNKIVKIYNGYDFSEIEIKSKVSVDFEEDSLIFIGRLEEQKGIKLLLDIYLDLIKKQINKKLYLLGDGELRPYVEEFIRKNNLYNHIILKGYVDNPYPYIKKASYIVMTSVAEGFPTVFVEGLALGVGFISTNVGGSEELSNNGLCGFVGNEKESFVNYLYEELSKDKDERLIKSSNCLKHVSKYTLEKQVDNLKKLLKEIDNE